MSQRKCTFFKASWGPLGRPKGPLLAPLASPRGPDGSFCEVKSMISTKKPSFYFAKLHFGTPGPRQGPSRWARKIHFFSLLSPKAQFGPPGGQFGAPQGSFWTLRTSIWSLPRSQIHIFTYSNIFVCEQHQFYYVPIFL